MPASSLLPAPALLPEKEVRLAVVMYGGVSLSIYINGIAQELLRLVRATAAEPGPEGLGPRRALALEERPGTEHVYRKLGQMLGRGPAALQDPGPEDAVRTRFVVDVLSGTSAGGLNAIFLAKALANGQRLDALKQLWVREADVGKLLNDEGSRTEDGVLEQQPPRSLLNSQWMYRKLLYAFDGMEEAPRSTPATVSPYVEELDLFVTATDIRGLPVSLRLADKVVRERRHRHVYQLRYRRGADDSRPELNDFHQGNNPLLAFAGRCTSAFPFAFEPMLFEDVNAVLGTVRGHPHPRVLDPEDWRGFFPAYRPPEGSAGRGGPESWRFETHAFGDGGYLDNKPFSYALDALAQRRSSLPVERKLVYVEPSPRDEEAEASGAERPNALENVLAAFSLPRYETIREDLQRVLARNRLLERVDRLLSRMEEDVHVREHRRMPYFHEDFASQGLDALIEREGLGYGGYHRLKVATVSDDLALMLARVSSFDPDSDHFLAIRSLVREWRELHYAANPPPGPGAPLSQNAFLVRYDYGFRLRRLSFVLGRIDRLAVLDARAERLLGLLRLPVPVGPEEVAALRARLQRLRDGLMQVFHELRGARARLERRDEDNPLLRVLRGHGLTPELLEGILQQREADARARWVRERLGQDARLTEALRALEAALEGYNREQLVRAASRCKELLDAPAQGVEQVAHQAVRAWYERYEHYDLISFPILSSTELGEESEAVEVVRISPEDATALLDEEALGRHKVAGSQLGHFGAFLQQDWREDDILWGRLDGAERLICMLLPGEEQREGRTRLIREAHVEVFAEELMVSRERAAQLLDGALGRLRAPGAAPGVGVTGLELLDTLRRLGGPGGGDNAVEAFLLRSVEHPEDMERRGALRAVARSTQVVGRLLDGLALEYRAMRGPARWGVAMGRLLWGWVEVATPQSLAGLVARHWLSLLYLFSSLCFLSGTVLRWSQVQGFGLVALLLTGGSHLAIAALGEVLDGRGRQGAGRVGRWARRALGALAAVGGLGLGVTLGVGLTVLLPRWGRVQELALEGLAYGLAGALGLGVLWLAGEGARARLRRWNGHPEALPGPQARAPVQALPVRQQARAGPEAATGPGTQTGAEAERKAG